MIKSRASKAECEVNIMAWYNTSGNDFDTVLSSRVRFARNIAGYPFAPDLPEKSAEKIISDVCKVYDGKDFKRIDFEKLSGAEAASYVEKHYVSPEFTAVKGPHTLLLNEGTGTAIMICEEDHVRLQSILPGLALEDAYRTACEYDDMLDKELDIAYDERLGYLTHCPTNLGTGMRASVMMFLPALTMTGKINALAIQLSKIGLTMRGLFGEGTESKGNLYQISNQVTLGISEEETLKKLGDIVAQINEQERKLRTTLRSENSDWLCDRIMRAEGTLKYAHMLSSSEFTELFSDIRLGIALGIIHDIDYMTLSSLLVEIMPATLTLSLDKKPKTEAERDRARAAHVKNVLNK